MEFTINHNGTERTIEVYWDDQPGVTPGWCWRGKGKDAQALGGDALPDIFEQDEAEMALEHVKAVWA